MALPKKFIEFAKQSPINTLKSSSGHKLPLVISKLPKLDTNMRVAQSRWKGVSDQDTFWTITRYKLRKDVTKKEDELIRGANKYNWRIIE
ncbi:hypothetical protein WALSEDRAFT_68557 [Wallemia mellicola CBS 633.66]|uniref:Uncharacterized protein n=1 Tax=Wallemia mellicola (strain ATCC MYA-4683 / CBS 633.66) TaxID=671144 RepID=I4YDN9_WALMC|nr:hypothetical protein WALSEDRAFT_68557 [Wallemia mellicola CBS 633.66]EIM22081.1 hypothetical protein WALSEDRAFT_68557 [Wallemia mellicola CBS 633.66]|eukprot:XP_006957885.1 hypothetical protein WALSEDRAFT_68557 [Wallemia mellicola CBS 633.66]